MISGRERTPRVRPSVLELGPRARVVFAVFYVGVMGAVIVSAQRRPDHVFGFQMFNESSTVNIHLFRRVRGRRNLEALPNGSFQDRSHGVVRTLSWLERVHDPVLSQLDTPTHAKYGLEGQLFRLQLALDDFVARLPRGSDTLGLVAVVETLKNGRDPQVVRLKAER
ncbi:MAG TPA: hypothetical protein VLJ38_10255 [Polyangiaceae bacterium]|nr:hypothetical protein [Polyangiaceae bacterium]